MVFECGYYSKLAYFNDKLPDHYCMHEQPIFYVKPKNTSTHVDLIKVVVCIVQPHWLIIFVIHYHCNCSIYCRILSLTAEARVGSDSVILYINDT